VANRDVRKIPTDRHFGLAFGCVFAALAAWAVWKHNVAAGWTMGGLSILFFISALLFARVLHPLNVAWGYVGLLLNKIVSPIAMGAIFFIVVTPVALAMRARGRDVLQRRFDRQRRSYWMDRNPPGPKIANFPRQF
jgi:hypothetical protein